MMTQEQERDRLIDADPDTVFGHDLERAMQESKREQDRMHALYDEDEQLKEAKRQSLEAVLEEDELKRAVQMSLSEVQL